MLLIDDVMTTGATAASCARALKRAGARQVTLLTLARVDRRTDVRPAVQRFEFLREIRRCLVSTDYIDRSWF